MKSGLDRGWISDLFLLPESQFLLSILRASKTDRRAFNGGQKESFKEEVFEKEDALALFEDYKKTYETDHNILIRNQFDVSEKVLKKQKQKIKTEIKLDTNVQIKLDVDAPDASAEYLERGYDEEKKMHYYKVFFNDEH